MNEQDFWKWVDSIGWSKMVAREKAGNQIDIDSIGKAAVSKLVAAYGKQQAQEIAGQIKAQYDRLVEAIYRVQDDCAEERNEDCWEDVAGISTDCRMDLNAHIVGCGEKAYYACLRSPVRMKNRCKWKNGHRQFVEGFQYIVYDMDDFARGE